MLLPDCAIAHQPCHFPTVPFHRPLKYLQAEDVLRDALHAHGRDLRDDVLL